MTVKKASSLISQRLERLGQEHGFKVTGAAARINFQHIRSIFVILFVGGRSRTGALARGRAVEGSGPELWPASRTRTARRSR